MSISVPKQRLIKPSEVSDNEMEHNYGTVSFHNMLSFNLLNKLVPIF